MQAEEEGGGRRRRKKKKRRGCRADRGLGRLGWGYKSGGGSNEGVGGGVTDEVPDGFIHQTGPAE